MTMSIVRRGKNISLPARRHVPLHFVLLLVMRGARHGHSLFLLRKCTLSL